MELSLAALVPRGAVRVAGAQARDHLSLTQHGRDYAHVEDGQRFALSAGDIVVFPHGDPHIMGNGRDVEPKDFAKILHEIFSQGLKLARMGAPFTSADGSCWRSLAWPRL